MNFDFAAHEKRYDIHKETASHLLKIDPKFVTPKIRYAMKSANFLRLYHSSESNINLLALAPVWGEIKKAQIKTRRKKRHERRSSRWTATR